MTRLQSYDHDLVGRSLRGLIRGGGATAVRPSAESGYRHQDGGRLFLKSQSYNLIPDPQGKTADGTFWPASTANTTITGSQALPVALPEGLATVTTCLKLVNDGTADAPQTANIPAGISASKLFYTFLYIYSGGPVTVTAETGHSFAVATIAGNNGGFVRYALATPTVVGETTMYLKFSFPGGSPCTVYVTAAMVMVDVGTLQPHVDGTCPDVVWSGTAHNSFSTPGASILKFQNDGVLPNSQGTIAVLVRAVGGSTGAAGPTMGLVNAPRGTTWYGLLLAMDTASNWDFYINDGTNNTYVRRTQAFNAGSAHVVVARYGANLNIMVDGTGAAPVANTATVLNLGTYIQVGQYGTGTDGKPGSGGWIVTAVFFPTELSDVQAGQLTAALMADPVALSGWIRRQGLTALVLPLDHDSVGLRIPAGLPSSLLDMLLVCDGDSLTLGTGADAGYDYPTQLAGLLAPSDVTLYNYGVGSQTLAQMEADAAAQVDVLLPSAHRKRILVCWGGINDVSAGADAATVEGRLQTYCANRRTAGWTVVVGTLTAAASITAGKETIRQDVNTWIRANWATFADVLVDLAANEHFDALADTTNYTYYSSVDGVHLTNLGYSIITAMAKEVIDSIT